MMATMTDNNNKGGNKGDEDARMVAAMKGDENYYNKR